MDLKEVPNRERRSIVAGTIMLPLVLSSKMAFAAAVGSQPEMIVQRLAWAGVRLQVGETTLFIDARTPDAAVGSPGPVLTRSAGRTFALVTHHHLDHYDPNALKPLLGERGYVVAHEAVVRMFQDRSVNVQPVGFHEPVFLSRTGGEFVARCVPAADGLGSPQVSWIVEGGGRKIIHCGDTAWHGGWWDIARAYGPFDAAFVPINGLRQKVGRYQNVQEPMSLTPEQAVRVGEILNATLLVPIHYGSIGDSSYVEEPDALRRFSKAASDQGIETRILEPGEKLRL